MDDREQHKNDPEEEENDDDEAKPVFPIYDQALLTKYYQLQAAVLDDREQHKNDPEEEENDDDEAPAAPTVAAPTPGYMFNGWVG